MLNFEKSSDEKLKIIQEETFNAYNIVNIAADAMMYRIENDDKNNCYDCILFLREAKKHLKHILNFY